jgi:hypothetical protein
MKPRTVAARATVTRPNRIHVALAAAWMILSLAIGGVLSAESPADASGPARNVTGATNR